MASIHPKRHSHFRSPGLRLFLQTLADTWPQSATLAALQARIPGVAPRQLARFVDTVEKAGLNWLHYETKTRGPWRLLFPPAEIGLAVGAMPNA